MYDRAVKRYQQVRAATSSPSQILLALYDGLFRFLNGAKACFEGGHATRGREQAVKAHSIISELYIALDYDVFPELCGHLSGVYGYCLDELISAMRDGKAEHIDDVLRALAPLRDAWHTAVRQGSQPPVAATG